MLGRAFADGQPQPRALLGRPRSPRDALKLLEQPPLLLFWDARAHVADETKHFTPIRVGAMSMVPSSV